MITVVRNYFKKSSKVVLWVIISAFLIGLLPVAFRGLSDSNVWVLRVDGQEVGEQEYRLEWERAREQVLAFKKQFGDLAEFSMITPQFLALQSLKKQELLNQFADKIGAYLSPEFVIQKLSDPMYVMQNLRDVIPPQLVDPVTGIDQVMLKQYLQRFKLSIDMFERIIERTLTDQFVIETVASTFYLPRFDVRQRYGAQYAKKQFSILEIPLQSFLQQEKKQTVTSEALKAFYDAQNQRYWVPEKRSGMMWEFDAKTYDISVANNQIEQYYENNKVKLFIDKPTKVQVRRILFAETNDIPWDVARAKALKTKDEIVNNPSQFAEIAKRFSEDEQTARNGGMMEPFVRGTYKVAFERPAFLLKEDGDVSEVIQTEKGFEILQRVSKTPPTFKSFASVKQEIKDTLVQQEFRRAFTSDMKKVIDNQETLAEFIRKKGGSPQELTRVLLDDTPVTNYLFKLQPGQRTFFVNDQKGVALQLDKEERRYLPDLDTIKDTVTQDLQEQRAQQMLEETVEKARSLAQTKSFQELKKEFNADVSQTDWIDPALNDAAESLKKKGVPVGQMLKMEKKG